MGKTNEETLFNAVNKVAQGQRTQVRKADGVTTVSGGVAEQKAQAQVRKAEGVTTVTKGGVTGLTSVSGGAASQKVKDLAKKADGTAKVRTQAEPVVRKHGKS